jgi:putative aldouronate transport system permease protein
MSRRKLSGNISRQWNLLINVILGAYVLICTMPFLLVVSVSFSDQNSLTLNGYAYIPSIFTLDAYRALFLSTSSILRVCGISVFVTVVGTLLSTLIIAMYAYPISRSTFRDRNFFTFVIFFTMLLNGGLVPWYIICVHVLHLKNTIWGLIIPYLFNTFYAIVMKTYFRSNIHESIVESAKLDGASELRIFRAIVMPLSLPVLASIGLFTSIGYWNDWWLSTILQDNNTWINLQFTMYKLLLNATFLSQLSTESGGLTQSALAKLPTETMRMAMCVVAMAPIVLAYPFFQRFFVKGLTIGAIKG